MRLLLIAAMLGALLPSQAIASCYAPSMYGYAPSPPSSLHRPDPPYCLGLYSNTCSQYELDSYVDEVNDYIDDLNDFYREAVSFANNATQFSNDALAYAKCEAKKATEDLR